MSILQSQNLDLYIKDKIVKIPLSTKFKDLDHIPFFQGNQVEGKEQSQESCIFRKHLIRIYQNILSDSFNRLVNNQLILNQVKAFCCRNLIFNIKNLLQQVPLLKNPIQSMKNINKIAMNIIQTQLKKYPQKIKKNGLIQDVNKEIPKTDKIACDQYDFFYLNKIKIPHNSTDVNYFPLIMESINKMIRLPSQKLKQNNSKTIFDFFNQMMTYIIKCCSDQVRKKVENASPCSPPTQEQLVQEIGQTVIKFVNENILLNNAKPTSYQIDDRNQLQRYIEELMSSEPFQQKLKNIQINTKISQKVAPYTQRQINSQKFQIRDSTILRITVKWVEQLLNIFQKPNSAIYDRTQKFKTNLFKFLNLEDISRKPNQLFDSLIEVINKLKKEFIDPYIEQIKQQNFKYQYIFGKEVNEGMYLTQKLANIGSFAAKLQKVTRGHMAFILNWLIHYLTLAPYELRKKENNNIKYKNQSREPSKRVEPYDQQLDSLSLVTFKMGDLIRGKYGGSQNEFIRFMKVIKYISSKKPQFLDIVRSKNRMDKDSNDVLMNILIKQKIVCQFQIYIKSASSYQEKLQKNTKQFQHIPYQFQRALMGPLSELTVVFIKEDIQIPEYFSKDIKSINQKVYLKNKQMMMKIIKTNLKKNDLKFREYIPILCSYCQEMIPVQTVKKNQQNSYKQSCFKCDIKLKIRDYQKQKNQQIKINILKQFLRNSNSLQQKQIKILNNVTVFQTQQWCKTTSSNDFQTKFSKFGYFANICKKKQPIRAFFGVSYYNKRIIYRIKSSFIQLVDSFKDYQFQQCLISAFLDIKLKSFIKSKKNYELDKDDKINIIQNLNEKQIIEIIMDVDSVFHLKRETEKQKQDAQNLIFWSLQQNFQNIIEDQFKIANNLMLNRQQAKFYQQFFKKRKHYQNIFQILVFNSINRDYLQNFFKTQNSKIFLNRFTNIQNWIIEQTLDKYEKECQQITQIISKNNAINNLSFQCKEIFNENKKIYQYFIQKIPEIQRKPVQIKWLKKLKNLEFLDFSHNQRIKTLIIDQNNKNIKEIIIQNSAINIDSHIKFMEKVKTIKMKSTNFTSNITQFNNGNQMINLTILCLSQILIQSQEFFLGCPKLVTLHLTQAYIQNLNIFKRLKYLQQLNLSKSVFIQKKKKIRYSSSLNISFSQFDQLDNNSVEQLRSKSSNSKKQVIILKKLILSQIKFIQCSNTFFLQKWSNEKLEYLDLFGTNFYQYQLLKIKNLKVLNLGNKKIVQNQMQIMEFISQLTNLEELYLQNLKTYNFQYLHKISKLKILNLSNTNIETFNIFHFYNLQNLCLNGCTLLKQFKILQTIQGSNQNIEEPFYKLKFLLMRETQIVQFPDLTHFPNLSTLDLKDCKQLQQLKISDFQKNLAYSDEAGQSYSLQQLNLGQNQIVKIKNIDFLINIKILHIHAKYFFKSQSVKKFLNLNKLEQLYIFGSLKNDQQGIILSYPNTFRTLRKLNISNASINESQLIQDKNANGIIEKRKKNQDNFKALEYLKFQNVIIFNELKSMNQVFLQIKNKPQLQVIKIIKCYRTNFKLNLINIPKLKQLRIVNSQIKSLEVNQNQFPNMKDIILVQNKILQQIPNLNSFPSLQTFCLINSQVKNIRTTKKLINLKLVYVPLNKYLERAQWLNCKEKYAPMLVRTELTPQKQYIKDASNDIQKYFKESQIDRRDEQINVYKELKFNQFYTPQISTQKQQHINKNGTYLDFSLKNSMYQYKQKYIKCTSPLIKEQKKNNFLNDQEECQFETSMYNDIEKILEQIKECKQAIVIDIRDNNIKSISQSNLNKFINQCPKIKVIDLRGNPINLQNKEIMKKFLQAHKSIKILWDQDKKQDK